jgi:glutamine synthetase
MKPDLTTLRPVPWLEGTAMVLCDLIDHHTHEPVPHMRRAQMLKAQVARAKAHGLHADDGDRAGVLPVREIFDDYPQVGLSRSRADLGYNEDYNILQTTKEEHVMRPIRNLLVAAGVPVENSKGEAETGQEELNIRYADALLAADHHTIAKQAVKEIAMQHGHAATLPAQVAPRQGGQCGAYHQSLMGKKGANAFHDPAQADHVGHDAVLRGGLLKYAPDITFFLAPYINSYKRFLPGTFAPTKIAWSVDNRTAGYRLVGDGTKGVRIECRIPGST